MFYVQTNMLSNDLIKLGTQFSKLLSKGIEQDRFPRDGQGQGEMINGVYYLTFDLDDSKESIRTYIFEDKK